MYIAIEGTKGTGKSTLLKQLEFALKCDGVIFETFRPTQAMPENMWWEKAFCQYAEDDQYIDALYTARANYHASRTNFDAPLVLGDRSILTSFITRWPKNTAEIQPFIKKIQAQEYAVPIPDLVLYLDQPLEVTLQRLATRQRNYGLADEQFERLRLAKSAYKQFFQSKDELGFEKMKFQIFDAQLSDDDLFAQVYDVFAEFLVKETIFQ